MGDNVLKDEGFCFAIRVVRLYQHLVARKQEYVLSKQLLRSGTSVGAMVREAEHAQSKADFIHKLSIAQKETNESLYWLDLLASTDYLIPAQAASLHTDAVELLKLLTSILKTAKSNLKPNINH
ncbi:MAG: four helix bundle protein [Cytophagaceae bacterium]|nr:MAG: four helix bundle protein [Cytophagaceae bacterium]